jgi:hypothetical protein
LVRTGKPRKAGILPRESCALTVSRRYSPPHQFTQASRARISTAEIPTYVTATNHAFRNPAVAQLLSPFTAARWPALDSAIATPSRIVACIDDYKLTMIATRMVIPLLIVLRKPPPRQSRGEAVRVRNTSRSKALVQR